MEEDTNRLIIPVLFVAIQILLVVYINRYNPSYSGLERTSKEEIKKAEELRLETEELRRQLRVTQDACEHPGSRRAVTFE